jgi:hypothetical protein
MEGRRVKRVRLLPAEKKSEAEEVGRSLGR